MNDDVVVGDTVVVVAGAAAAAAGNVDGVDAGENVQKVVNGRANGVARPTAITSVAQTPSQTHAPCTSAASRL